MGSSSSHTSEMTLALSRGLCLSPPCVPKCGVRCCHHPSGPWRTSRVIPALFNPSHVGCGGLRKLQWDIPPSGVEFDGGEFGFWGLPAAPHEQSLRCDPTWPRSGEQLPSPHTLWGAQGGQRSPLVHLWGRECVGTFPSQPAEPDSALGRGGRSCQTPPQRCRAAPRGFFGPKKSSRKLPPPCGHCKNSRGRLLGEEEFWWNRWEHGMGSWCRVQEPLAAGSLAGASPALSQCGSAAPSKF